MGRAVGKGSLRRKRPRFRVEAAVVIVVVVVVVGIVVASYLPTQRSGGIIINWRLKLHILDQRTNTNYTLPAGIGAGTYWANHTLDKFGPPGYAPVSTRDNTGTIYIQANSATDPNTGAALIFTFGDLFNIWGETLTRTCVTNPLDSSLYCESPAETVVYDSDSDGIYQSPEPPILGRQPTNGTRLAQDPKVKFVDLNNDGIWNLNETVVYDRYGNNSFTPGDYVIRGPSPQPGTRLSFDPKIRFVDTNGNGVWDQPRAPPIMSDGSNDSCVNRRFGLSNNKDWVILIGGIVDALNCTPTG